MRITKIIEEVFGPIHLMSKKELEDYIGMFEIAIDLGGGEIDTLIAAHNHGPLFDGDVPSKSGRDSLLASHCIAKVVVKGEDGFNACTHKGAWVLKLHNAIKEA